MRTLGANLVSGLKSTINDARTSTIFVQTLYESQNFNAGADTDKVLNDYFAKNAFGKAQHDTKNTKFRKEKMNNTSEIGRQTAKVFAGTKLKFKD